MDIYKICTYFLHQHYTGEPIRSINISLTNLIREGEEQISLFDNVTQREQEVKLTKVMDEIRTKFGKNSILQGISYTYSATARHRNILIWVLSCMQTASAGKNPFPCKVSFGIVNNKFYVEFK